MSRRSPAILGLLIGAITVGQAVAGSDAGLPVRSDPRLIEVAREARQTIAVIDWFYVRHRACPQPSRPAELVALQDGLGDVGMDGPRRHQSCQAVIVCNTAKGAVP